MEYKAHDPDCGPRALPVVPERPGWTLWKPGAQTRNAEHESCLVGDKRVIASPCVILSI